MEQLKPEQFREFFRELHKEGDKVYDPFPWQERLALQVAAGGDWPGALALPTAAGKTACIDIAIFALACQADLPMGERTVPRRVFFVVDRRVIVDQAYRRALKIRRKLREALADPGGGILAAVAQRLRKLAAGGDNEERYAPLECYALRGGVYREDGWARSPLQPAVIASTVDQVGSRLLFRGYGSSDSMRPIHAALVANDSLIIVDEAHCAVPFLQTATAVARYRGWSLARDGEALPDTPFRVVVLSATPPGDAGPPFVIDDNDRNNETLKRRMTASKPAVLKEAKAARGDKALDKLAEQLVKEALDLAGGKPGAIAVMVNRVYTARAVSRLLREKSADDTRHETVLLMGRMRPLDRDRSYEGLKRIETGNKERGLEKPLFVVATQTLEVGADLDFDGLVTECASLDALRQRFGRLNRDGRPIKARAVIVVRADQADTEKAEKEPDPVYGTRVAETWVWLNQKAARTGEETSVGFGIAEFDALASDPAEREKALRDLSAPTPDAPVMLPAHVDCWTQTSPEPKPDPEPSLFLHGPSSGAPDVQVCWRADLPTDRTDREDEWADIVDLCPPASAECMPVPLHALRRWLRGEITEIASEDADVEGVAVDQGDTDNDGIRDRRVLIWRGPEKSRIITNGSDLSPGDTVVIPVTLAGWDVFGHIPEDAAKDLGDQANWVARRVPVLRLRQELIDALPAGPARDALAQYSGTEPPEDEDAVFEATRELAEEDSVPGWLREVVGGLFAPRQRRGLSVHPAGGLVLRGKRRVPPGPQKDEYTPLADLHTGDDDSASATVEVPLDVHSHGVHDWAERFAREAGLPPPIVEDVALAGLLHDFGKADPRFQVWLYGGHRWVANPDRLLGKSGGLPDSRTARDQARREAGYPKGGRHELLSVRLAQSGDAAAHLSKAHDPDLVLHLIASHHGECRPFAPVVDDGSDRAVLGKIAGLHVTAPIEQTGMARLDSGIPDRFWRLVRKYGWWRLAYLESLLRLADHRCSEAEQKAHEAKDTRPGTPVEAVR